MRYHEFIVASSFMGFFFTSYQWIRKCHSEALHDSTPRARSGDIHVLRITHVDIWPCGSYLSGAMRRGLGWAASHSGFLMLVYFVHMTLMNIGTRWASLKDELDEDSTAAR